MAGWKKTNKGVGMDIFSTAIRLHYLGSLGLQYEFMGFNARLRLGHFKTK